MTSEPIQADTFIAYWTAIRAQACAACLDVADDGSCGLRGRLCALAGHLPLIVRAIGSVESARMDEYVEAIEAHVCRGCHEQDARGRCRLRDRGDCALYAYLPLVVDAVEEVRGGGSR